jgi:ABC-type Fe3+ transport system substrate-binding protein
MKQRGILLLVGAVLLVLALTALPLAGVYAGPLDQVIEGAKKEGTVSVMLSAIFPPESMKRLGSEIRGKYGVDLDIKMTPSTSMSRNLAQVITEYKTGATPTYDLMNLSDIYIIDANKAGVFQKLDWAPLISKDTNPEAIMKHPALRGSLIIYTAHRVLMYNSKKIAPNEAPKTLAELASPKWHGEGKVGIMQYTGSWTVRAFIMGKEKTMSEVRTILRNKGIKARYPDLLNRFLIDEIKLAIVSAPYLQMARDKGIPVGSEHLDYADMQNFPVIVMKDAQHPNAAKLVAIYLASPEGARFTSEVGGGANRLYPGNYEHDLAQQAKKRGIPAHSLSSFPGLVEFNLSKEWRKWRKEMKLVLQGG